jgi:hypothetical protein
MGILFCRLEFPIADKLLSSGTEFVQVMGAGGMLFFRRRHGSLDIDKI